MKTKHNFEVIIHNGKENESVGIYETLREALEESPHIDKLLDEDPLPENYTEIEERDEHGNHHESRYYH